MSNPPIEPGVVFRFGGAYLLNDLMVGRTSVSRISEFNDPYELHFEPKHNLDAAQALAFRGTMHPELLEGTSDINRSGREQVALKDVDFLCNQLPFYMQTMADATVRTLCLTRQIDQLDDCEKMWSHYGDFHRGVRFHIRPAFWERPGFAYHKVKCDDEVPRYDLENLMNKELTMKFIGMLIAKKSSKWEEEKELRITIGVKEIWQELGTDARMRDFVHLYPFHVARVDFGLRFPADERDTWVQKLSHALPELTLCQAKKNPTNYVSAYEQITPA